MARKTREASLGALLPQVRTPPPGPQSRALAAALSRYESPGVSPLALGDIPIFWEEAAGANVRDADGNIYIDLTAAFGVASVGHRNEGVISALQAQAQKLLHGMGDVFPCTVRAELDQKLAEIAPGPLSKSILACTGSEAVEIALRTAALYTGRTAFLAFHGGFHGQSYGALQVTSRRPFRNPFWAHLHHGVAFAPYPYCYRCPFQQQYPSCGLACLSFLESLLDNPSSGLGEVAAIIVEPIQGRGGVIVPPPDFLPRLRQICDGRGLLLIADEVFTGLGRTGEWFAVNHRGVVPDVMALGKGLGGGLPIAACIAKGPLMDAWQPANGEAAYSSTFMAHPLGCAAALATLKEIEEKGLLQRARRMGDYLMERFEELRQKYALIGDVRGQGMMVGVELVKDRQTKAPASQEAAHMVAQALARGIILLRAAAFANVIALSPPLIITPEQLDYALGVLDESLAQL